jgi:hypothetical protein
MSEGAGGYLLAVTSTARDRFYRLVGFQPSYSEWLALVMQILDRKGLLTAVEDSGAQHWTLECRGEAVRVIWDPHRPALITVLPRNQRHLPARTERPRPEQLVTWNFDA